MYRYIRGLVVEKGLDYIVLDVGGIGYQLLTSLNSLHSLIAGEMATLYTIMIVKEDEISLCGFVEDEERQFFEHLTGVSGIGKKNAISMLSASNYAQIASMIINADEKALVSLPSIGKKTAQRLIVELKDKLSKEYGNLKLQGSAEAQSALEGLFNHGVTDGVSKTVDEAMMALKGLGFTHTEVHEMLKGLDLERLSVEQIISGALSRG